MYNVIQLFLTLQMSASQPVYKIVKLVFLKHDITSAGCIKVGGICTAKCKDSCYHV